MNFKKLLSLILTFAMTFSLIVKVGAKSKPDEIFSLDTVTSEIDKNIMSEDSNIALIEDRNVLTGTNDTDDYAFKYSPKPEIITLGSSSEDFTESDYEYTVSDSGATIVAYKGFDNDVVIPVKIDGYSVTAIGESAFYNTYIKSVIIPDNVRVIGKEAFEYCLRLENIILGSSIEKIDKYTFGECSSITDIVIPDNVKSGSVKFILAM